MKFAQRRQSGFSRGIAVCLLGFAAACGQSAPPRTAGPYNSHASETVLLSGDKDLCIVTQYTSNQDSFASLAADNHQHYAASHRYRAYAYRGRISGELFSDPSHSNRVWRDGLYWQKLAATRMVLDRVSSTGAPVCRWVMWLDADAIFTNFDRPLEHVLAPYQDKDVVLAREHRDTLINAGVFFVKNSPKGRAFVDTVTAMYATHKDRGLPEQMAMQDYAFDTTVPEPTPALFDTLLPRLREEVAIAPQRIFDSFHIDGASFDPIESWEPCDLVAHIAGTRANRRVEMMQELMNSMTTCPL